MKKIVSLGLICSYFFISSCQTVSNVNENTPESTPKEKKISAAKINVQLGIAYLERKDLQRARQKLVFALEQAPSIPETWYAMGYFLENTGNTKEAEQYYLKSIALAPQRGDVLNNYGTYLCRTKKYQLAIHYFNQAVKDKTYMDPSGTFENAANCALKIPQLADAKLYFTRALEEDPNHVSALLGLAEVYYQEKNYAAAKKKLQEFLRFSAPNVQSFQLEKKLEKV